MTRADDVDDLVLSRLARRPGSRSWDVAQAVFRVRGYTATKGRDRLVRGRLQRLLAAGLVVAGADADGTRLWSLNPRRSRVRLIEATDLATFKRETLGMALVLDLGRSALLVPLPDDDDDDDDDDDGGGAGSNHT